MGLLEKQFDIWKLERMWKMGEPKISEHDKQEVLTFQTFLDDRPKMKREEFYRKYQHYLGLTDGELDEMLKKK